MTSSIPPARLPEDDPVFDIGDVICHAIHPDTKEQCSRVALFDLVWEFNCRHVEPYPVCLPHKDLIEWGMEEFADRIDVHCLDCRPAMALGRLLDVKNLRCPE